jgi:hypothetical protein
LKNGAANILMDNELTIAIQNDARVSKIIFIGTQVGGICAKVGVEAIIEMKVVATEAIAKMLADAGLNVIQSFAT